MATHMNDFAAHKSGLDALEARLKAHMAAETSRAKFEMLTWGLGVLLVNDGVLLTAIRLLN